MLRWNSQHVIRKPLQQPGILLICGLHTQCIEQLCPKDIVVLGKLSSHKIKLRKPVINIIQLAMRNIIELAILERLYPLVGYLLLIKAFDRYNYISILHKPTGNLQIIPAIEATQESFIDKMNMLASEARFQQVVAFINFAVLNMFEQMARQFVSQWINSVQKAQKPFHVTQAIFCLVKKDAQLVNYVALNQLDFQHSNISSQIETQSIQFGTQFCYLMELGFRSNVLRNNFMYLYKAIDRSTLEVDNLNLVLCFIYKNMLLCRFLHTPNLMSRQAGEAEYL